MASKHKVILSFEKTAKSVSYGGVPTAENMVSLIKYVFPSLDLSAVGVTDNEGKQINVRTMAELCASSLKPLKFRLVRGITPVVSQSTGSNRKVKHAGEKKIKEHSRSTSVITTSVKPILELPDELEWPYVLESDHPAVVFNTTDLNKVREIVDSLNSDIHAHYLYRQIDNEFAESVYLYKKGLLNSSIEMNSNVQKNILSFLESCKEETNFNPISDSDEKLDHLPAEELLGLLNELETENLMDQGDIKAVVRAYNMRPLLLKPIIRDYFDGIIPIMTLAYSISNKDQDKTRGFFPRSVS